MTRKSKEPLPDHLRRNKDGMFVCSTCGGKVISVAMEHRAFSGGHSLMCRDEDCEASPIKKIKVLVPTYSVGVVVNRYEKRYKNLQIKSHEHEVTVLRDAYIADSRLGKLLESFILKLHRSSRRVDAEDLGWGFQRGSSRNSFLKSLRAIIYGAKARPKQGGTSTKYR